jgi:hypothetical protein
MMASKGRRICIKVFEVGCSVPTIEVPCKPEHGEFGTPLAKRPIKAFTEFLDRAYQEGYFDQMDLARYIAITDFPKLRKTLSEKHLYMNQLEKPVVAVKQSIME